MPILRSLLAPLQAEFKQSVERGALFVYTLIAVILPFTTSRTSNLLRCLTTVFRLNITRRKFYIFLASPKIPWDRLWHVVWRLIPMPLTEGRLLFALDDSINPKTGKKIFACHHFFDHAAKANQSAYPWAQNIVQLGLIKQIHQRWACLPVAFRFYRLKKDLQSGFKTKLEQSVAMIKQVASVFLKAPIVVITDSWFGNDGLFKPLRTELGQRIHVLSRLRSNANLYHLPPQCRRKRRGAPKKYGKKRGTAKTLAPYKIKQARTIQAFLYGKKRSIKVADELVMLKTLKVQVRVVWVFYKKRWVALYSTELNLSVEQIVEYYGARWKIESGFKELKQEIGSQACQARNKLHVMNHLHLCSMAVTITWCYCAHLKNAPTRRHAIKGRDHFAFSDVRHLIASQIDPENFEGVLKKTKKPRKINLIDAILKLAA